MSDTQHNPSLVVLGAVRELHRGGYQRVRITAGLASSGMYWRCGIVTADGVQDNGWQPIDRGSTLAFYTSGMETRYFGWDDASLDDAAALAARMLERLPALAQRGRGPDPDYAAWFDQAVAAAEAGELPVFYDEGGYAPVTVPPPPAD